ncbi:MAG: hypothetical protein ACOYOB_02915 [Myxococcota bacterium]
MVRKVFAALFLVAALGIVGYWLATGAHPYTQHKVAVQVAFEDPVTGEKTTREEWRDQYQLGGMDRALPTAGVLTVLALGLLWWNRKANKVG